MSPALWYFRYIASIFLTLHKRLCMEGLECKNWDEMSVTDTIFGRWERAAETMLTLEMKLEAILMCRLAIVIGIIF